jgi:hypothetical protein
MTDYKCPVSGLKCICDRTTVIGACGERLREPTEREAERIRRETVGLGGISWVIVDELTPGPEGQDEALSALNWTPVKEVLGPRIKGRIVTEQEQRADYLRTVCRLGAECKCAADYLANGALIPRDCEYWRRP